MNKIINFYRNFKEIINYIIVGIFTTIVSLGSYYFCVLTFLNPQNPVYLQFANIISWICSVTFAYFANKKYVFESEEKNILKEGIKFYSARLLTLFLDMSFMFLLVSIFDVNDKISKILVQFIILICNYIISKFLVFNKEKLSLNVKLKLKNITFILFLIIFFGILFYCYPLVGDDWGKKSEPLFDAIKSGVELWKTFNGRFFGNILVIIMKYNFTFKVIFQTTTITLLIYFIYKILKNNRITSLLLILLLFFLMPISMYRESISWMSGFANFIVPALSMIIIIYIFSKIYDNNSIIEFKWYEYIIVFISGIFMNMFSEHTALFSIAFSIGLMIISLIFNKKVYLIHFVFLFSTILGCTLMFLSPVYWSGLPRTSGNDFYNNLNLIDKIFLNIKKSDWLKYMFFDNIVLNAFISFVFLYNMKKKNIIYKLISILLFLFYIIIGPLISFDKIILFNKYKLILSIIIIIIHLLLIYMLFKNNKKLFWMLLFYYFSSYIVAIPLLEADSFGLRCFFSSYILQILFALTIYYSSVKNNTLLNIPIVICSVIVCSFMLYSAIKINETKHLREKNISLAIEQNQKNVFIEQYPFSFMLHQDGDARGEGYHQMVFKSYYGIDQLANIYFVDENYKEEKIDSDFEKLKIPTYDGSGQLTHPSVVKLKKPVSGYKYWMAFTPWPNNNNKYENPSIIASNDGEIWVEPDGIKNPISGIPQNEKDYYSDPFLFYHDNIFELWYRFNPYKYKNNKSLTQNNIIYRVVSEDGISWSEPEIIFDSEKDQMYMSISVIYENGIYNVWYSNLYGYAVYRQSENLKDWTEPVYIDIQNYDDNVWHSEVKKVVGGYEMLFYSNVKNEIYLAKTTDKYNFSDLCLIDTSFFKKGKNIGKVYKSSYILDGLYLYLYVPYDKISNNENYWSLYLKKYSVNEFYDSCKKYSV